MAKQRKRRDPEKERSWREVMRRQRQSGLTVSAFCAAEGLKDWSFHWWRRELAKRDREKPAAKVAIPRKLFRAILQRIARLKMKSPLPVPG